MELTECNTGRVVDVRYERDAEYANDEPGHVAESVDALVTVEMLLCLTDDDGESYTELVGYTFRMSPSEVENLQTVTCPEVDCEVEVVLV